ATQRNCGMETSMKRLLLSTALACLITAPAHAAWLGSAVDSRANSQFPGVVVRSVTEGSPAAAAGLREGDLIVAAQMRPLRNAAEFDRLVRSAGGGTRISFALLRNGTPVEVTAVLAPAPTQLAHKSGRTGSVHPAAASSDGGVARRGAWNGVFVETLTP